MLFLNFVFVFALVTKTNDLKRAHNNKQKLSIIWPVLSENHMIGRKVLWIFSKLLIIKKVLTCLMLTHYEILMHTNVIFN